MYLVFISISIPVSLLATTKGRLYKVRYFIPCLPLCALGWKYCQYNQFENWKGRTYFSKRCVASIILFSSQLQETSLRICHIPCLRLAKTIRLPACELQCSEGPSMFAVVGFEPRSFRP
jgi:hypothetical protein